MSWMPIWERGLDLGIISIITDFFAQRSSSATIVTTPINFQSGITPVRSSKVLPYWQSRIDRTRSHSRQPHPPRAIRSLHTTDKLMFRDRIFSSRASLQCTTWSNTIPCTLPTTLQQSTAGQYPHQRLASKTLSHSFAVLRIFSFVHNVISRYPRYAQPTDR
jgi:hypothetical protein